MRRLPGTTVVAALAVLASAVPAGAARSGDRLHRHRPGAREHGAVRPAGRLHRGGHGVRGAAERPARVSYLQSRWDDHAGLPEHPAAATGRCTWWTPGHRARPCDTARARTRAATRPGRVIALRTRTIHRGPPEDTLSGRPELTGLTPDLLARTRPRTSAAAPRCSPTSSARRRGPAPTRRAGTAPWPATPRPDPTRRARMRPGLGTGHAALSAGPAGADGDERWRCPDAALPCRATARRSHSPAPPAGPSPTTATRALAPPPRVRPYPPRGRPTPMPARPRGTALPPPRPPPRPTGPAVHRDRPGRVPAHADLRVDAGRIQADRQEGLRQPRPSRDTPGRSTTSSSTTPKGPTTASRRW